MSIPDVGIAQSSIPDIGTRVEPLSLDLLIPRLPHGVSMELPVVNMPGCVEAHVDSSLQTGLTTNDPDRVAIYCDAGMPSFSAMSYEPGQLQSVFKTDLPKIPPQSPNSPEPDEVQPMPLPGHQIATAQTKEKTQVKPRCKDGDYLRNGECISAAVPEDPIVQIAEKYLPPLDAVTTTATIATVATVSALLAKPAASFLLKLIKPIIKKLIAKIQKAFGKPAPIRSVRQRVLAQRVRRQARDLKG